MTVFFDKARDHWRYDFWHAGKRYTGYCDDPRTGEAARTKTQAKHVEDIIRGAVKAQPATAKPSAPTGYSVAEAFAEYADEARHKRSWSNIKRYIRELVAYFGPDSLLSDVDEDAIASYVAWARRQPVLRFAGGRGTRGAIRAGCAAKGRSTAISTACGRCSTGRTSTGRSPPSRRSAG